MKKKLSKKNISKKTKQLNKEINCIENNLMNAHLIINKIKEM